MGRKEEEEMRKEGRKEGRNEMDDCTGDAAATTKLFLETKRVRAQTTTEKESGNI